MTEKHSQLLPCPFCGQPPFVDDDEDGVCCITCANDNCLGVEITCPTREDAAAFWNTRVVNGLPEAIAALEDIVTQMERKGMGGWTVAKKARTVLSKLKG